MNAVRLTSLKELPKACAELNSAAIASNAATGRRSKYKNTPTYVDGQRFDSKAEARYYQMLVAKWQRGEIRWFTRQVPFQLPGGVTYRCDFFVVLPDGVIDVVDVKGILTDVSRIKIRQVEYIYGIKVRLWPERHER
jgi:hypothetical protein